MTYQKIQLLQELYSFTKKTNISKNNITKTMVAVEIKKVTKYFPNQKKKVIALDNISLSIKEGEIFGLLGPNGAGKTTLINILAGLVTYDEGSIRIFDKDFKKNLKEIQRIINVVPGFTHLNSGLSIDEFLQLYAYSYNVKDWKQQREHVLSILELQGHRNVELRQLSSGYKQRALLAKALLTKPKIILMDEPTVGLDVEIAIKMRDIIKNLKKQNYTILLTTHNMLEAEELCDRIALISHGKIVGTGTSKTIKQRVTEKIHIEIECEKPEHICVLLREYRIFVDQKQSTVNTLVLVVDTQEKIKQVMRIVAEVKEKIYSIRIKEPTLEEAFIRLTRKK